MKEGVQRERRVEKKDGFDYSKGRGASISAREERVNK